MNIPRYLGRKLDDSLPDFVTFVVSRFWNWGKRDNNPHFIVTDKCIAHKNPPKRVFFANSCLPKQKPINVWRTADDDVLYAGRLSYVQPDERHE